MVSAEPVNHLIPGSLFTFNEVSADTFSLCLTGKTGEVTNHNYFNMYSGGKSQ